MENIINVNRRPASPNEVVEKVKISSNKAKK